ncbi:MAG: hypothetical protein HN350_09355 [Phycisphaerales bacterium]|jgi:hypothetical protein|nr:hypothetical protein [Phycisphaerales bacterium]
MESIQTALFEEPLTIYIVLGIIAIVGLVIFRRQRTRKSARTLLFALASAAVVFAISTLVVTDREQIRAAVDEIGLAINSDNVQAVERFIDDDFSATSPYSTRAKAIHWIKRNIKQYEITNVTLKILSLDITNDQAEMQIISDVNTKTIPLMRFPWDVKWTKRSGQWRILNVSESTSILKVGQKAP